MATAKKPTREDRQKDLDQDPEQIEVDVDDAMIEEPRDDAFRKPAQPPQPSKRRRKKA